MGDLAGGCSRDGNALAGGGLGAITYPWQNKFSGLQLLDLQLSHLKGIVDKVKQGMNKQCLRILLLVNHLTKQGLAICPL